MPFLGSLRFFMQLTMALPLFKRALSVSFLLLSCHLLLSGQTILWQEDFSGAPPPPGWDDSNFTDCDGTAGSFNGVQNGRYEVIDMEGFPCCAAGGGDDNQWVTNDISINGYCNVSITVDYGSAGVLECVAGGPYFGCSGNVSIDNGHDQIVMEYSINGGPWVQFFYLCGGGNGNASVSGLSGNTIRVRVRPANKAVGETYWFDNVQITGVLPTVDPVNDIVVCAGSAVNVTFSGTGNPAPTFDWTNDNTAIGLGASGSGNLSFTPPTSITSQEVANITVTPTSSGCTGTPETFTITVNPLPLTDDPADLVACAGDQVDIVFTGSDPNATYHWQVNGIPPNPLFPTSGTGNITGTVPPIPFSVSGTVTVHAVSAEGCPGPDQTFTVTLNPAISATFAMNTPPNLCQGSQASFTVNFSGGNAPYTFTYALDGVEQPPLTTNSDPYTFTLPVSGPLNVSAVRITAGNGCVKDVTGSFDINVIPTPVATLNGGTANICSGSSVDLTIDFNGSDDYTIVYSINGTQQPAVTTTGPTYTFPVTPASGTTTYTLVSVSSNGCTGTASGTFVVNTTDAPTAIISGNPVACAGQTVNIPVNFTGTAPWSFVYAIDGVDQPEITTSNNPYLITASYNSTVNLTLSSVASGLCAGTVSGTAVVTVQAGVTGILTSGSNSICVGQSDVLNFNFTGTGPFTFTYSVNGVNQAPINTNNNTYQLTVTPGVTTTYIMTNVSNSSCPGGTASGTYIVNIANPPTAIIAGTDTICAEHSTALTVTFTGQSPWTFAYAANGNPVDTITTSSNPYLIPVSPMNTTTYTLTQVSSGTCTGSVSGSATVKVNPNPTVTLTGGGQICQSGNGTDLIFTFTGKAPWKVTYKANNDTLMATSSVSPLLLHVNPNIGTIYKLIEISDSLCTDTAVGMAIVFVFTPANAQMLGSAVFCDSADTQVMVDFTGTGPFTINYTINGVAQQPDTTFDDPYIIPVHVTSTTSYQLTSIESPGCTGIISGGPAVITVNYPPTYSNLHLNCNLVAGTYVVTFDALGATLPLTSVGGNSGTFSGNTWTSNPIPMNQNYSFTFHDANNCGNVNVSGANTCSCTTAAGNMGLAPIEACASQVINAAYNGGFVNDGNDTLLYILHSNPALPYGTIYGWSNQPSFGFLPGMSAGTTYYVSAIAGNISPAGLVDTSNLCTVVSQGTPVLFHALPSADLGISTTDLCLGDSLTLTVNFTGSAPFSFAPAIGGVQQPVVSGINGSSYSWTITPISSVVVTPDSIADQYCPSGQLTGMATINVVQPPVAGNIQTQCNYGNATYTVTFDILSGTPPFNVSGIAGFFAGNSFTSLPIPFASGTYFATLSDAGNCGQDTITGLSNCNCVGNAGTMSQTQVNACQSAVLSVPPAQNPMPDADDVLMYIMHTNAGLPVGTILAWSATPDFNFAAPMQTGVVYYISSVVGNPDGAGMIDLNDPCLSVSTGTPVQWWPTPTANLTNGNYNICPGQSQALLITLTGTPNFTLGYTNNGNPFTVTATQTAFLLSATLQQTATFILTSVSDAHCPGTVMGTAVVNVHPAPGITHYVTSCSPATQTYTVEFDVSPGDASTTNITGQAGTYNPVTGHFISDPIPSNQPYTVIINDSWNCGTFTFSDTVSCACGTNAGIMDPSPLTPCYGQTVSTSDAAGAQLEAGDTLVYFLVGQANMPPNWTIVAVSATPTFAFNPATMTPSTTYYIVAVAGNKGAPNGIDLSDPCLSVVPGPSVVWHPEITATLSGSPTVCPGSQASISVQFTGDGPFNFSYTDGANPKNLSNITQNPYTILVNPAVSTGYNLVAVTGAGGCPGTISGSAMVTVAAPPQALNVVATCDFATQTYVLTFDIGNGAQANPTYTVTGIQGTLNDTTFTSIAYPGAQPYTVIISNPTGCTASITGTPNCVCSTGAGTLSNAMNGCLPNGMVSAQSAGDQHLDSDDALVYVLCSDPAQLPLGILAQSSTPSFAFQNGMTAGITYYIVAIAGNALNGSVDPTDPCLSVSPGVPVVFNFPPSGLINGDKTVCAGENATFQVQLAGVAPYHFVYAINGIAQPAVTTPIGTFNIQSNNVQQNQVFTLVSISDANCPGMVDGQAMLTVAQPPTGSINSDITICAGDSVALKLDLKGGTAYDLTISGSTPPIQLNGVQDGDTFSVTPSTTTTYTITTLMATGNTCTAEIGSDATVTLSSVNATSQLSNFNGFNTTCASSNDGTITVTPTSGISPVTASWSNGATGLDVTHLTAGSYSVTLTDQIGCTFVDSFNIQSPPALQIDYTAKAPTCFGNKNGAISVEDVAGGAGPYKLSLNNVAVETTDQFPVRIPNLESGTQSLTVEDANGCFSTTDVEVPAALELLVNLGPDTTIHLGDQVQLLPSLTSSGNLAGFEWRPGLYLNNPDTLTPVSTPVNSVRYTLIVTDSSGCTARDDIEVIVERTKRVYIPNIFEPGSDLNNLLTVYGGSEVIKVNYLRIFDRWGDMVFENENFTPGDTAAGWDGRAKGQDVSPAVFVYVVEVEYVDGTTETFSGDVTVVR